MPRMKLKQLHQSGASDGNSISWNDTNGVWESIAGGVSTSVATLSALRALVDPAEVKVVLVEGHSSNFDGGEGLFGWDPNSVATDNDGTIIKATLVATGRWRRLYDGSVNVKWFGAVGDGVIDDQPAIQAAVDTGEEIIFFPRGNYLIEDKITCTTAQRMSFIGTSPDGETLYGSRIKIDFSGTGSSRDAFECAGFKYRKFHDLAFYTEDDTYLDAFIHIENEAAQNVGFAQFERLYFEGVPLDSIPAKTSGTAVGSTGSSTVLTDTGATFTGDGIAEGDWVFNNTDGSACRVVSVDSDTQITTTKLRSGTGNTWDDSDSYDVRGQSSVTCVRVNTTGLSQGDNISFRDIRFIAAKQGIQFSSNQCVGYKLSKIHIVDVDYGIVFADDVDNWTGEGGGMISGDSIQHTSDFFVAEYQTTIYLRSPGYHASYTFTNVTTEMSGNVVLDVSSDRIWGPVNVVNITGLRNSRNDRTAPLVKVGPASIVNLYGALLRSTSGQDEFEIDGDVQGDAVLNVHGSFIGDYEDFSLSKNKFGFYSIQNCYQTGISEGQVISNNIMNRGDGHQEYVLDRFSLPCSLTGSMKIPLHANNPGGQLDIRRWLPEDVTVTRLIFNITSTTATSGVFRVRMGFLGTAVSGINATIAGIREINLKTSAILPGDTGFTLDDSNLDLEAGEITVQRTNDNCLDADGYCLIEYMYTTNGVEYDVYGDLIAAIADDGGSQTTETTEASNSTANDVTLLPATPAVNDAYYFGASYRFQNLWIDIGTQGVGTWTIEWQYYNGSSWTALSGVTDGTTGFTAAIGNRYVDWSLPSAWRKTTINGIEAYYVRAIVTSYTSVTTQPLANQVRVA